MNFNVTKLKDGIKRFVPWFLRALRVLRGVLMLLEDRAVVSSGMLGNVDSPSPCTDFTRRHLLQNRHLHRAGLWGLDNIQAGIAINLILLPGAFITGEIARCDRGNSFRVFLHFMPALAGLTDF